jgi:GntR family transcriptional regulator
MFLELDRQDGRPVYLQIIDEVRRQVALHILRADDPLPPVRELAAQLKVNPNTVQHAYRELSREGVAYVKRGQGTFVSAKAVGKGEISKQRHAALARQIAQKALREAYRNGLVGSDLVAALRDLS